MAADPVLPISSLSLEKKQSGDTITVLCHGRLVSDTTQKLQDEVKRIISEARVVVLDLSDVKYMDSSGLGALVRLYVSARQAGKQLKLVNLSDRVKELLRISKLLSVFEGYGEYL